jgi:hypothetical protein
MRVGYVLRITLISPVLFLLSGAGFAGAPTVELNEVDFSATDGFIELYDGGVGGTSLDGLVVVMYEGVGDTVASAFDLDTFATGPSGYFVLGRATVPNVDLVIGGAVREAVALYTGDSVDYPVGAPVDLANLIDAYAPMFDAGLASLVLVGATYQVASGASRGRCPDGSGGARDTTQFVWVTPTPGAPSACLDVPSFCNGLDGSNASCVCGGGAPDSGCDKPIPSMQGGGTTGGVRLSVTGMTTAPLNRATITAFGHHPTGVGAALVVRSSSQRPTPAVFGDGILCVGAPVVRVSGGSFAGGYATLTLGHGAMAGAGLFYYQAWLRNVPTFYCDPVAPFTTSSGVKITW